MNTELEHLKRMRELIANGWTQHVTARNAMGIRVSTFSTDATCYCLLGALYNVTFGDSRAFKAAFHFLDKALPLESRVYTSVARWSDHPIRTHADVLALIDRAIEIAEVEQ